MTNIFKDRKTDETLVEAAQRYVFLLRVTGDARGTGTQMMNYYGLLEMTKVSCIIYYHIITIYVRIKHIIHTCLSECSLISIIRDVSDS